MPTFMERIPNNRIIFNNILLTVGIKLSSKAKMARTCF